MLWFDCRAQIQFCRRNVEMSPGAQSRDDTLSGGGHEPPLIVRIIWKPYVPDIDHAVVILNVATIPVDSIRV
jgi:hypothetical protein